MRRRVSPMRWAASTRTSLAVMKGSSRINCRTNVAFFMPAFLERRASNRSSSSVKRTVKMAMTNRTMYVNCMSIDYSARSMAASDGLAPVTAEAQFDCAVITVIMSEMKIEIRRVGNSLGVILPKFALDSWGLGEGDFLELTERSIRPRASSILSVEILDEHKRKLAVAVASLFTPNLIRAHSLANLHRWRRNGVWVSAYDEWKEIMETSNDGALFAVML